MTKHLEPLTVGERLLIARRRAGLSTKQLADRIGVTYQTVGNWERGHTTPRDRDVADAADALDLESPAVLDPDLRNRCSPEQVAS